MRNIYNLLLAIFISSFLFSCKNSNSTEKSETTSKNEYNCQVLYETHIKKRGVEKSVIPYRQKSQVNQYSQMKVVIFKLECDNNKIKSLIDVINKNTIQSEMYSETDFKNIDELLSTVDSSGITTNNSVESIEEAAEFMHNIDNEIVYINKNYISIRKTEEHAVRISGRPLGFFSTSTYRISSGNKIELTDVLKSERKSQLNKILNDTIQKYAHESIYDYYGKEAEITEDYNITKEGINLYYLYRGFNWVTIKYKKEFIKEYLNIDFWE